MYIVLDYIDTTSKSIVYKLNDIMMWFALCHGSWCTTPGPSPNAAGKTPPNFGLNQQEMSKHSLSEWNPFVIWVSSIHVSFTDSRCPSTCDALSARSLDWPKLHGRLLPNLNRSKVQPQRLHRQQSSWRSLSPGEVTRRCAAWHV